MTWILFPSAVRPPACAGAGAEGPFIWIEHPLFFGCRRRVLRFHRLKLILHRASMKAAAAAAVATGAEVHYIDAAKAATWYTHPAIASAEDTLHVYDPVDHDLEAEIRRRLKGHGRDIQWHPSPLFLTTREDLAAYPGTLSQAVFYRWQLARLAVPGITRSLDTENRKALPADVALPPEMPPSEGEDAAFVSEAVAYVRRLPTVGAADAPFTYPVTPAYARRWLAAFVAHRLAQFGPYQDALAPGTVFHSVLSSSLNIGLLTPREVLDAVVVARGRVPASSYEGFVRQLIGWREYERWLYVRYRAEMLASNAWKAETRLPRRGWYPAAGTGAVATASSVLPDPVAAVITQAHSTAYMHHIQRLMVVLNWMTLQGIRPRDIYSWFMAYSIDSYDWVMVPNVYTMGYVWPGAMRKPYVSSSAYLVRMGAARGDWCDKWDAAFYAFLLRHEDIFKKTVYAGILQKIKARHEE